MPNENKIRFGMSAVKGVGVGAVEEVLRARERVCSCRWKILPSVFQPASSTEKLGNRLLNLVHLMIWRSI